MSRRKSEEKILKRIELIKNLKDKHSLEEIAKIISPEISDRHFTKEDLNIIEEIDEEFLCTAVSTFERESFSYIELLLLISISELKKERNLSKEEVSDILAGIKDYDNNLRSTAYLFMVFDRDYYTTLLQEGTEIIVDSRLKVLKKVSLNELSNKIKIKYKKNFKIGGV
ncbi:MAG: DUF4004 family protein [Bacillota bacterium]